MTQSTRQVLEQAHRAGVQFLLSDLVIGLTFLDVAEVTVSEEIRTRNRRQACVAYETVLRLLPRVSPSEDEWVALEAKLGLLRERLDALGFVFDPEKQERPGNAGDPHPIQQIKDRSPIT